MNVVRPASSADAPRIVQFQVSMALETEELALDPAIVASGVAAVFEDPAKGRYWVAERGGQVAGMLLTVREWSDWRNGTVLWVHSVYVDPPVRRSGVYRALYDHLRAIVDEDEGLVGLRLYVDKRNTGAQETYEMLGMTREHYHLYEWMK